MTRPKPFGKKASGVLAPIDLLAAIIDVTGYRLDLDGHFLPRALETKGVAAAGPEKFPHRRP